MLKSNGQWEMTISRRAAAYASFSALAILFVLVGLPGSSAFAQRNKIEATYKKELAQGVKGEVGGGISGRVPGGVSGGVIGGVERNTLVGGASAGVEGGVQLQNSKRRSAQTDRALYEAAESGDIESINELLNAGADANCALDGDGSPLIGAARKGRIAAVRLLLDRGADPNMPVSGDGNPLIMAARNGHADVVSLLLDRGASIDQMVPGDENALIQASGAGHLNVVRLLVGRGADVNARTLVERTNGESEWRTPLSMARKGGHEAVIAFLLEAGARE